MSLANVQRFFELFPANSAALQDHIVPLWAERDPAVTNEYFRHLLPQ
jgi:hypothetical protein